MTLVQNVFSFQLPSIAQIRNHWTAFKSPSEQKCSVNVMEPLGELLLHNNNSAPSVSVILIAKRLQTQCTILLLTALSLMFSVS